MYVEYSCSVLVLVMPIMVPQFNIPVEDMSVSEKLTYFSEAEEEIYTLLALPPAVLPFTTGEPETSIEPILYTPPPLVVAVLPVIVPPLMAKLAPELI